jgi:hypothetical protein
MALREMGEDERAAAREKLTGELRARVTALLTPPQRTKYQALQAQAASSGPRPAAQAPSASAAVTSKNIANSDQSALGSGKKDPKNAPVARCERLPPVQARRRDGRGAGSPTGAAPAPGATAASPGAGAAPPAPAAPGAPGANAATEFRNRLVAELALSPAQVEKVDAIYADARPKFATLRDLPAEERPKARDRIMADIRARIGDVLTPEQKPKYAALVAQAASRQNTRGRIYLLGEDGKPVAYNVRLGITDGTSTELIVPAGSPEAPVLKEGAVVITGTVTPGSAPPKPATTGPRMPF